jgi:hypothetical protein
MNIGTVAGSVAGSGEGAIPVVRDTPDPDDGGEQEQRRNGNGGRARAEWLGSHRGEVGALVVRSVADSWAVTAWTTS